MNQQETGSVLGSSGRKDVRAEPFAYSVVDRPIPAELYARLSESFPPPEAFLGELEEVQSNQAVRIPASRVIGNPAFSPEWQAFFRYHTSDAFWADIVRVFGDSIRATYPDLEARVGKPLEDWTTKLRGEAGEAEVDFDLLFVINTAVEKPNSVRPPHVDDERKLFSGLFYMRPEDDATPGGDLAIYRAKPDELRFGGHYVEERDIARSKLIDYTANRFIGFVNSERSVHGVTPRPQTEAIRRYINFVAELPFPLFKLQKLPWHRKQLFRLTRKDKAAGVTLGFGARVD
ncbi:MAG: hypothetical protein WDZ84_13935 [Rhodovibrionaceae bacterium]